MLHRIAIDPTGQHRVQDRKTGLYLVAPVDAWGKVEPTWTDIPEAAFGFSKNAALDQVSYLGWHPHKLAARVCKPVRVHTPA